jgi:hypothetical protein
VTTREEQDALWRETYANLTADQKRVADDILKRSGDRSDQQLEWAEELFALVETLGREEDASWPVVRMFWVRLHGVFAELIEAHRTATEIAKTLSPDQLARNLSKYSLAIFTACEGILASLDETEVVVADYLRQRAVHLRQSGYSVQSTKSGVRDSRHIPHIAKTFSIEDIDRRRDQVVATYGSEAVFARHVSRRVARPVGQLVHALRTLHSLPPR